MRSQVLVSFLISCILGDEVEIFSADDECAVHLRGDNGAGQDSAADRDHAGEGTFLVCGRDLLLGDWGYFEARKVVIPM